MFPLPPFITHRFLAMVLFGATAFIGGCQTSQAVSATPVLPGSNGTALPDEPGVEQTIEATPAAVVPTTPVKEVASQKELASQAAIREQFVERMNTLKAGMARLGSREFSTERYLDKLLQAGANGRDQAFPKVMNTLGNRLELEAQMLDSVLEAKVLYTQFTAATEAERQHLLATNKLMDDELGVIASELKVQVGRLATALKTKSSLSTFTAFTDQKSEYVERMQHQLTNAEAPPSLDLYFDRWEELLKTRIIADQFQILNLAYYAQAFGWKDALDEVMGTVSALSAADYLKDAGKSSIEAGNLVTVLDAGFGEMVKTVIKPEPAPADRTGFKVSITPDRGMGGVYYYSDTPDGLVNPTKVVRADGSFYFAERISFTVASSRDASFIMRHIDAKGKAQQLAPNQYAKTANRLRANQSLLIPGSAMPFEFAASEPQGIEAIRLIVTPQAITYDVALDKVEVETDQVFVDELAMTGKSKYRGTTRGLKLQKRVSSLAASSYDQAFFDDNQTGNAVMVETFIYVLPLTR